MNRISILIGSALALTAIAPAQAEKSDRIVIENMRARIMAARSDLGPNGAGGVELTEAESRLRDLSKALDDNETADARASVNGIEALIAAARVRVSAASRTPTAVPARWAPTSDSVPVRKRIIYKKPDQTKRACAIASR